MALDRLHTEVTVGSELLYDGLPAAPLDGQPLAAAITAHLACPAIPAAEELLAGLCAAVGLCLVCAELVSSLCRMGRSGPCGHRLLRCSGQCRGPGISGVRCLTASAGCRLPRSQAMTCRWQAMAAPQPLSASRAAVPGQAAMATEDCQCGGGGGGSWRHCRSRCAAPSQAHAGCSSSSLSHGDPCGWDGGLIVVVTS